MSVDVLQSKIRKMKNPTMVCLCPSYDDLPEEIRREAAEQYGQTLKAAAESLRVFSFGILDALAELVPAVSVESGCYLALGRDGAAAMEDVLAYAAKKGYYVLLDAMRADIGSAAENLAQACFGGIAVGDSRFAPYACDGILLNGYLGSDSVRPFTQFCANGKNVFLIARSSNKSAREVQDLIAGDRLVYQVIADLAMRWSIDVFGKNGYSEIGLAVGATNPRVLQRLREKYDRLFFLVPGYGAQGGRAADAAAAFDKFGHGAIVMAGRSILNAWKKQESDGKDYQAQAREAALRMREQLLGYVTVI